jgi:Ribonuclease G/E
MITPKNINASKVIDMVQSNYKSITVNDKHIEAGTSKQYLIDDFIPKLTAFTIRTYDGELPKYYTYKVDIKRKDGSQITLFDNDYLVIDNRKYEILEGKFNLDKFYNIFMN